MANNCYYTMSISGREEDVETLIKQLQFKEKPYIGRVFDCSKYDENSAISVPGSGDFICAHVSGDCAWSVASSMIDAGLIDASIQHNLLLEIFSEESGMGFAEHYVISQGNILVSEEENFFHYCVYDELLDDYIIRTLFNGDQKKYINARSSSSIIESSEYRDAISAFNDSYNNKTPEQILNDYNALSGESLSLEDELTRFDDDCYYLEVGGFLSWNDTYPLSMAIDEHKYMPDKNQFSSYLYMKRRTISKADASGM